MNKNNLQEAFIKNSARLGMLNEGVLLLADYLLSMQVTASQLALIAGIPGTTKEGGALPKDVMLKGQENDIKKMGAIATSLNECLDVAGNMLNAHDSVSEADALRFDRCKDILITIENEGSEARFNDEFK